MERTPQARPKKREIGAPIPEPKKAKTDQPDYFDPEQMPSPFGGLGAPCPPSDKEMADRYLHRANQAEARLDGAMMALDHVFGHHINTEQSR